MTVTTEDVKGKRFPTVRRDGYDPTLVDRYLEDFEQAALNVEAKRAGLDEANTSLRGALVAANERVRALEVELGGALDEARAAAQAPAPAPTPAPVPVVADAAIVASHSATRLLEIATRDAEALVVEARDEADQSLATARAEAAEIIQTALGKVHAREEALDAMAAEQRDELDRMRAETLRDLEGRRAELDARVSELSDHESRYRSELVSYFSEQLEVLGRPTVADTLAAEHAEHPQAS